MTAPAGHLRALVVDWGGVLTEPLDDAIRAWAQVDGVDYDHYVAVMRDWLGPHQGELARDNPVAALERGEIEVPRFEEQLAARLSAAIGRSVPATGLLQRMFDHFVDAPAMAGVVLRARRAGLRTGLLSNSWGNEYPREGWDEMFDAVVISGEVGMRKPEPEIFAHMADLLGVPAEQTVFVDDLPHNVEAARAVGLVAVRHTDYASTVAELEALFGLPLG
jgi:epoxide hydrolase-like predicted phosphatase